MNVFPTQIRKGTTVRLSIPATAEFDSTNYGLKLLLRSGTHISTDAVAMLSTNGWELQLNPSVTTYLATGSFTYELRVISIHNSDIFTYEAGIVKVIPSATDADSELAKSNNERLLEKVNTAVDKCIEEGLSEYAIGDRSAKKLPLNDLLKLQRELILLVQREKNGRQAGKFFKVIKPRYIN